jgi:tetratricopeptide (TPR) repeat protein
MSRLFAWFSGGVASAVVDDDDAINSDDDNENPINNNNDESSVVAASDNDDSADASNGQKDDDVVIDIVDDDVAASSNNNQEECSGNDNNNSPPSQMIRCNNDRIDSDGQHDNIVEEEGNNVSQSVEDISVAEEEDQTSKLKQHFTDDNPKDDSSLTGEVDNTHFAETKQTLPLNPTTADVTTNDDHEEEQEEEQIDDSFPKAREFLAETINDDNATTLNHRDDITIDSISRTRKAAEIVEGFDDDQIDDKYNAADDSKTIATNRTSVSRVQPVSAAFKSASQEVAKKKNVHPHQSIFDILDKNFEQLGEGSSGSGGGSRFGKKIAYQDVKLCFIAFVAVFSLPQESVFANPVYSDANAVVAPDESNGDVAQLESENQLLESTINGDERRINVKTDDELLESRKKSTTRPSVPLTVAFALWSKVLQHSHGNGNGFTNDDLSYIRSTLVLLGLLELKSIERDRDDDVAPSSNNRLVGYSSNRSIECLSVQDEIHQQYGEYLAWGDHDSSSRSFVEEHEWQWNEAVMEESNQIGYNQYTLRMLPLNTMRANHMQDAFDLLKDKTFVRRRMRALGASEAAKAHVGDVDEILRLIEKRMSTGGGVDAEPIDEQEALLSAYLQLQKYCLHEAEELTKHYKDEDGNIKLGKAMMPKMADLGDAVHLMGASLGGYGFYGEEMEYYEEALRLKRLAVNGNIMKSVSAAETLHCMGFSLDNVGKGDDALECYDQALDIRLGCLGDNDLRVADTYHNKGALLCEEDRPDEAMECLEEALRIRELHYGEEHVSCADTMVSFY